MISYSYSNALRNAVGCTVTGYDNGVPFIGTIAEASVKFGDDIGVFVRLGEPCGLAATGELLGFLGSELCNGSGSHSTNLHVYF